MNQRLSYNVISITLLTYTTGNGNRTALRGDQAITSAQNTPQPHTLTAHLPLTHTHAYNNI